MAAFIYVLCAAAALGCAALLLAGYRRSGARLLFWGGLCFVALTANNLLVFVDIVLVPDLAPRADLFVWRNLTALVGGVLLVYGLVWDTR